MIRTIIFCLLFISIEQTQAGPLTRFATRCASILEKPFVETVENNEGEILFLRDRANPEQYVAIDLGRRLGAGFFGSALVVQSITDPDLEAQIRGAEGAHYTGDVVVKIPHAPRGFGRLVRPWLFAQIESKRELELYRQLAAHASTITTHPLFPQNAAYSQGVLPVAPISAALRTRRGLMLFKPLIRGKTLKDFSQIVAENNGQLPEPYLSALRDHYQYVQVLYSTLTVKRNMVMTTGFSGDIRPPNLVYVDDPELLEYLGYTKPGFVSYELASVPGSQPVYIDGKGKSFDEYLKEFLQYVARSE